ncbi:hypothetical protein ABK040_010291 [Willaertia magna]
MKVKTLRTRYWLIVASKDHVSKGKELGIAQACHGKDGPLKRMKTGDRVVYYSSKLVFENGSTKTNICQCFTAIGTISNQDTPYQVEMTPTFKPWRINVNYDKDSKIVNIKSMIDKLSFIENKKSWGMYFRGGFRELSEDDFNVIETEMIKQEGKF